MTGTQQLIQEIEALSEKTGIAASTLCRKAVNDGKLIERLRRGGQVTLETADEVRRFLRSYQVKSGEKAA